MAPLLACAPPALRIPLCAPRAASTLHFARHAGLGCSAPAARACAARLGSGLPLAASLALPAALGATAPLGPRQSNAAPGAPGATPLAWALSPPASCAALVATWTARAAPVLPALHARLVGLWALRGPLPPPPASCAQQAPMAQLLGSASALAALLEATTPAQAPRMPRCVHCAPREHSPLVGLHHALLAPRGPMAAPWGPMPPPFASSGALPGGGMGGAVRAPFSSSPPPHPVISHFFSLTHTHAPCAAPLGHPTTRWDPPRS